MTLDLELPESEYISSNDADISYLIGKSPAKYPCYRRASFVLPSCLVDSFVHQILFYGPDINGEQINENASDFGWKFSTRDGIHDEFITMQEFEAVLLCLIQKSPDKYSMLLRWIEHTRALLKDRPVCSLIPETLYRSGIMSSHERQTIRQVYAKHQLFPLYLNGAKSLVYFLIMRLLTDIIGNRSDQTVWKAIIEKGFAEE